MYEQTGTPQQRQIALDADRALWLTEVAKMRELIASDGMDSAVMRAFEAFVQLDHLVLARWVLAALVNAADVSHLASTAEVVEALKSALLAAPTCQPGVDRVCIQHSAPYAVLTLGQAGMLRTVESIEDGS